MPTNPFALLADDGGSDAGDVPVPKQSQSAPVASAPKTTKPQQAGKIANATAKRFIPGQSSRPQKQSNELPAGDAPAGSQAQFDGERGADARGAGVQRGRGGRGGRGGERGRGGRGGRGGPRQERPDRRSQTGREDSHKAEQQGWGGEDGQKELEAETAAAGDAATEAKEGGEGEQAAAQVNGDKADAAAAETAEPAEPEDNTQTYEEYLKSRAEKTINGVTPLSARKANDGADDAQWKDGVRVEKSEEDYFAASAAKERAAKNKQRKEKTFLEVEFAPPARQERGGDRGGRGGPRGRGRGGDSSERGTRGAGRGAGGRGRGSGPSRGGRGGASNNASISLDDSKAFPSLA